MVIGNGWSPMIPRARQSDVAASDAVPKALQPPILPSGEHTGFRAPRASQSRRYGNRYGPPENPLSVSAVRNSPDMEIARGLQHQGERLSADHLGAVPRRCSDDPIFGSPVEHDQEYDAINAQA